MANDLPCDQPGAQVPVDVGRACHDSVSDVLDQVLRMQKDGEWKLAGYLFKQGPDQVILLFK